MKGLPMPERKGKRIKNQKQEQSQLQVQLTERRRTGLDELAVPSTAVMLPGASILNGDLGHDEEANGDDLLDDSEESGEPGADVVAVEEPEAAGPGFLPDVPRQLTLADLLGSRPPVVLLRVDSTGDAITVRSCAAPSSERAAEALELLRCFVERRFNDGRSNFSDEEWAELLGRAPAPLTRRLLLLLRLAIGGSEKVRLGEDREGGAEAAEGPTITFHDVGLWRFAGKFATLPDGTPFSLSMLLVDERGREGGHFFDQLPDAVKLLALRRALRMERERRRADSDIEFRHSLQQALEDLLETDVPKPTVDHVRRRLRDNFKRKKELKGLPPLFPNQQARQQDYDRLPAPASLSREGTG